MQEVLATIAPHEKIPVKEHLSLVFCLLRHLSQARSKNPSADAWLKPRYLGQRAMAISLVHTWYTFSLTSPSSSHHGGDGCDGGVVG